MGLFTVATDYNPDAYGLSLADESIVISTRDVDGSVREAKKYHTRKRQIDGVITVGTDASMTVAAVANALDLPGIKFINAEAASNKLKMRARLKECAVPCPDFFECWTETEAINNYRHLGLQTVVIKPTDNMGARGVSRATTESEVREAFHFAKEASPTGEVIIEGFMAGPELSIDALVYDGEVHISGIADRIIDYPPFFIETGHIMPTNLPQHQIDDAISIMRQGIKALGINIGAAKGDIKITENGAMVGEIAARLSGGFMSAYTYPYATGVDLIGNAIRIALGLPPENMAPQFNRVSMESAIIPGEGLITAISGIEQALDIPGVRHVFMNVDVGDTISMPRSNVEKAGHIIAEAESREQVIAITRLAQQNIQFKLSN